MSVVIEYDDGKEAWSEFTCSSCGVDMDYFGVDQKPLLEASEDGKPWPCPNCKTALPVENRTV